MSGDPFWQAICAQGLKVAAPVAALHRAPGRQEYEGRCDIAEPEGRLGRLLARLAGFPPAGRDVPLGLTCEDRNGARHWIRDFGGHVTRSTLRYDSRTGHVIERFGPFTLHLALSARDGRLAMRVARLALLGVPVPGPLRPRSSTVEYADDAGRFRFDVAASVPLLGPFMRYAGYIEPR